MIMIDSGKESDFGVPSHKHTKESKKYSGTST